MVGLGFSGQDGEREVFEGYFETGCEKDLGCLNSLILVLLVVMVSQLPQILLLRISLPTPLHLLPLNRHRPRPMLRLPKQRLRILTLPIIPLHIIRPLKVECRRRLLPVRMPVHLFWEVFFGLDFGVFPVGGALGFFVVDAGVLSEGCDLGFYLGELLLQLTAPLFQIF